MISFPLLLPGERERTSDGAMYDRAVFELDSDRLIGEFHKKTNELHGGRASVGGCMCVDTR